MHDRLLLLPVLVGQRAEVVATQIEEAGITATRQIDRGGRFLEVGRGDALALDLVVLQEPLVGRQRDIPAPLPLLVDVEAPRRLDGPAERLVAGTQRRRQEGLLVLLEDAGRADVVGAVHQPVPPLHLAEDALAAEDGRRDGEVVVGRQIPEERQRRAVAERRRGDEAGGEEARLALHRRVRRREIRHVEERHTPELDGGVLVVDHLLAVVVDDLGSFHLPQRGTRGVLLARLAGRVGALLEGGGFAAGALGTRRGEARLVRRLDAQRIDEAVAEVVRQLKPFAGGDGAVGLGQARIALGIDAARVAVIGDAVGLEHPALVVEVHVADSRNGVLVVVVDDLARLDDEVLVLVAALLGGGGEAIVERALRVRSLRRADAQRRRDR